jgi:FtsP/CotA-like multicopper oxidase with cupredoxin domain
MKTQKACEAIAITATEKYSTSCRPSPFWVFLWILASMLLAPAAVAQPQGFIPCAPFGKQPLIKIPEITRDPGTNRLKGVVITADEQRNLWFKNGANFFCAAQYMRYYKGYRLGHPEDWNVKNYAVSGFPEPLPGPTLRARVGDLVEITFLNQINTLHYGNSIDRGERGEGCDTSTSGAPNWLANTAYKGGNIIKPQSNNAGGYYFAVTTSGTSGAAAPTFPQSPGQTVTDGTVTWTNQGTNVAIYPGSDKMPNCIHGSSTTNIHFHGTHTTPSTTGDNVLLQVRPSLRNPDGTLEVTEKTVEKPFAEFFSWCEKNGSPAQWQQLPAEFRDQQMGPWEKDPHGLIGKYDQTAPYKPVPLWPPNEEVIKRGGWPQYYVGAFPYCFRLPTMLLGGKKYEMYQSPGTHWYHAHKHGSTDINVSNGMTGAFIIEGPYDDTLKAFYKSTPQHKSWDLEEVVMVFQQLTTTTNLLRGGGAGGSAALSVNGRQQPIVSMRPNQVQMWRLVNSDSRNLVTLCPFASGIIWRQTAQDGVQFKPANYTNVGKENAAINMAAGNRVDLLVKAPATPGDYVLKISTGVAPGTCPGNTTLLNVTVGSSNAADPPMPFISEADFPEFPHFLDDIPVDEIHVHRELVFNSVNNPNLNPPPHSRNAPPANSHFIDNRQFSDQHVDQVMLLDTAEEWKIMNLTNSAGVGNIAHPFHIHVNPFQITEVFNPNGADAQKGGKCYADPTNPETWKPCPGASPKKDFVWWDVFAIPPGRQDTLSCTAKDQCPEQVRDQVHCPGNGESCTIIVPGYFKMHSRFADFTGQYVLHCHILAHEDRGMMQLVEVVPNSTIYGHH